MQKYKNTSRRQSLPFVLGACLEKGSTLDEPVLVMGRGAAIWFRLSA